MYSGSGLRTMPFGNSKSRAFVMSCGVLLVALFIVLVAACTTGSDHGDGASERTRSVEAQRTPAGIHAAYVLAVQSGASPEYRVAPDGTAQNPAQALALRFEPSGVSVRPHRGTWSLRLRVDAFGCAEERLPVEPGELKVDASLPNRVRQTGGKLDTWYLNGPLGLEQGFEVFEAPDCEGGDLSIAVGVRGLTPTSGPRGDVQLLTDAGERVMDVNGLFVTDAGGRMLAARLRAEDDAVVIDIDAEGAEYPLSIDPMWTQQQKLLASNGVSNDRFGEMVALSGDTAVVASRINSSVYANGKHMERGAVGRAPNDPRANQLSYHRRRYHRCWRPCHHRARRRPGCCLCVRA